MQQGENNQQLTKIDDELVDIAKAKQLAKQQSIDSWKQQATKAQGELFDLAGGDVLASVEQVIRFLPSQKVREYLRNIFISKYKSMDDDGSISFYLGNKQRFEAMTFIRELIDKRVSPIFRRYGADFAYLLGNPNPNKSQIKQALTHYNNLIKSEQKVNLPLFLLTEHKTTELAQRLAQAMMIKQQATMTDLINKRGADAIKEDLTHNLGKILLACYEVLNAENYHLKHTAEQPPTHRTLLLLSEKAFSLIEKVKKGTASMKEITAHLSKLQSDKAWLKRLKTLQNRQIEHLSIASGEVAKGRSLYVSNKALGEYEARIKKNWEFLKRMIITNVADHNEQLELAQMYLKSNANPAIRRIELMTRLRGCEEWAQAHQMKAYMLTLTAPSKYHAMLEAGKYNNKYHGANPKDTQEYLTKLWAQMRAIFNERKISAYYGARIVEPHHDGTPHWHILLFVQKEIAKELLTVFKEKALEEDGNERGAKEHRCKITYIDPNKGSAVGYIAKYISKNIDGGFNNDLLSDEDYQQDEQGFKLEQGVYGAENAKRVRAWASLWGIRQFQFFGGASITVYRELRRFIGGLKKSVEPYDPKLYGMNEKTAIIAKSADEGNFYEYLEGQGGALAKTNSLHLRPFYVESKPNEHGECYKKVKGIERIDGSFRLITKEKEWKLEKIDEARFQDQNQLKQTGQRPAWTCVNNCKQGQAPLPRANEYEKGLKHLDYRKRIEIINLIMQYQREKRAKPPKEYILINGDWGTWEEYSEEYREMSNLHSYLDQRRYLIAKRSPTRGLKVLATMLNSSEIRALYDGEKVQIGNTRQFVSLDARGGLVHLKD